MFLVYVFQTEEMALNSFRQEGKACNSHVLCCSWDYWREAELASCTAQNAGVTRSVSIVYSAELICFVAIALEFETYPRPKLLGKII